MSQVIRGGYYNRTIFLGEIRSTSPQTTEIAEIYGLSRKSLFVKNNLDKNISLQIQGSGNGVDFVDIGEAQKVDTNTTMIIGENKVPQLKDYFPYLRAVITASEVPTSGKVIVQVIASL